VSAADGSVAHTCSLSVRSTGAIRGISGGACASSGDPAAVQMGSEVARVLRRGRTNISGNTKRLELKKYGTPPAALKARVHWISGTKKRRRWTSLEPGYFEFV